MKDQPRPVKHSVHRAADYWRCYACGALHSWRMTRCPNR
jgi:hypothetical protein